MDKSPENVGRAKKLFVDYLGNPFLMQHDGVEEEYRSFDISQAQESVWLEELKADLVSKLSDGDYSVISKLWQMSAQDVLPKILAISPEGDSWTKLRFAEDLWRFTEMHATHPADPLLIKQAREKAIEMWRDLSRTARNPTIPEEVMRIAANGQTPYEYFRDRLKANLKKALTSAV